MLDDFWGTEEWERFDESMKLVFPDRPIVEIEDENTIFHTVYDLDDRYQVPGSSGRYGVARRIAMTAKPLIGAEFMTIRDVFMVAISCNSDLGDSWEWADDPSYPEKYSALGIRIGVNYVMYAMTH